MTRRGATKALVLAYLRIDRAIGPMIEYMRNRHGLSSSAVRECVSRLVDSGEVERLSLGRYRRVKDERL